MITLRSSFGSRGSRSTFSCVDLAHLVGLEPIDLIAGHVAHLLVGLGVAHLAGAGQLVARGLELAGTHRRRARAARARVPSRRSASGSLVTSGRREVGLQVVVLSGDVEELCVDVRATVGATAARRANVRHDSAAGGCTWTLPGLVGPVAAAFGPSAPAGFGSVTLSSGSLGEIGAALRDLLAVGLQRLAPWTRSRLRSDRRSAASS